MEFIEIFAIIADMSKESSKFESLPEENTLPLRIKASEKIAEHGESTAWKVMAGTPEGRERLVALKEVRELKFANEAEMKKDRAFYDFLKNYPGFGKFVPETLHFKARATEESEPQLFRLQKYVEGKTIDKIKDVELYADPSVARQLLELADVSIKILDEARREKKLQPDFRRAMEYDTALAIIGGLISNPRYSKNIMIADKPDKDGERVFFVDVSPNWEERTSKLQEILVRKIVNPLEIMHLKRWKDKLEKILEQK